jgi:hypothetical protein
VFDGYPCSCKNVSNSHSHVNVFSDDLAGWLDFDFQINCFFTKKHVNKNMLRKI